MSPHQLFSVASALAMGGWLVLAFTPKSNVAEALVYRAGLPLGFSVLYAVALATAGPVPGGGFGSIEQVRALFASDWALLAGWVHYLAFDLYIGGILSRKMDEQRFAPWLRLPILFMTFMFGPVGLLLHSVAARLKKRTKAA